MALTKKERDALPDSDFAVPETRDLPMQDKLHIGMAWKMVDQTKGLTDEQRKEARDRILRKAKELDMDTSDWEKDIKAAPDANEPYADKGDMNPPSDVKEPKPKELSAFIDEQTEYNDRESLMNDMEKQTEEQENLEQIARMHGMSMSAMAIEFPDPVKDHPNQAPFKGVLTRLDEPSDNPLSGSNGKRVILPKSVAEKALSSLIGMAVDFTDGLDGHDVKQKIGLITEANIKGNEIEIAGFFYGADFPSEVKRIQAEKARLGFSFEAQAQVRSMNDDPLVIKNCVFTGAAVLYKDMAAYTTTSLSAKKMENDEMTPELKKLIEDMSSKIDSLESKLAASAEDAKLKAGNISAFVKPHSDGLRACADGMKMAGMGMHANRGHVAMLHGMADQMDSEAALGKMPHIYQNYDFLNAGADKAHAKQESEEMKKLSASLDEVKTQIIDMEKARFDAASQPERKTLTPAITNLLAKAGIVPDADGAKIKVADLDKKLSASNMSVAQRMGIKIDLQNAGLLN